MKTNDERCVDVRNRQTSVADEKTYSRHDENAVVSRLVKCLAMVVMWLVVAEREEMIER